MTISEIARKYNAEPFEVAAALDIKHISDDQEVTEYTDAEIDEIFTALAELNDN